jgi:peroxiredoxin
MKKISFVVLLFLFSLSAWSQAGYKSLSAYKQDRATLVKDSAGLILSADNWFTKVQSGDYTLSAITDETSQIPTFLLRKSTDEERKNFLASKEKRGPITLAGFTTGQPLIDFSVSDLNGKVLTKESFAGKILVINFWFKDAAPSKAEIPDLNKIVDRYKNKNIAFLAPTYDPADEVKDFLKTNPFKYIICADVDDMIINMKITKYPTHVIVDQNGVVKFVSIGQTGNVLETLIREIEQLL